MSLAGVGADVCNRRHLSASVAILSVGTGAGVAVADGAPSVGERRHLVEDLLLGRFAVFLAQ